MRLGYWPTLGSLQNWRMAYGVWRMAYGVWRMAYGDGLAGCSRRRSRGTVEHHAGLRPNIRAASNIFARRSWLHGSTLYGQIAIQCGLSLNGGNPT